MNVTSENVADVINNLTSIISTVNTTEDQNIANVHTVQTVLAQTASLLQSPTLRGTIPQTVVEKVHEIGTAAVQLCYFETRNLFAGCNWCCNYC